MEGWLWIGGIVGVIVLISWISSARDQWGQRKYQEVVDENKQLKTDLYLYRTQQAEAEDAKKELEKDRKVFQQLLQERTQNFPLIGEVWSDYIQLKDTAREDNLRNKQRPAVRAADELKEIKKEKRELAKSLIYWKYKAQNYETIYPWLTEELEEDIKDDVQAEVYYTVYSEKEREDPVTQFVSPEDYRKLSITERNQLALDRYWRRGKKTKWMIGKMYERYVGHLYEKDGWDVEFFGIHKRFEDLGRDLIAKKGKEIHVVQCKNWSRFKTIYENHIFQLFGTTYGLSKEHTGKKVIPVFYCSTSLSETANEFSKRLGIKVIQNHPFREYPAIKCNISAKGEKIYHLPFDQQYDNIKITPKTGEFYALTVKDAEEKGFRRAFRWSGKK